MKNHIDNQKRLTLLFDFYGGLLKAGQKRCIDMYLNDDLTMAEIAEEMQLSRQAVHHMIKKAEQVMERQEEIIGAVSSYNNRKDQVAKIKQILSEFDKTVEAEQIDRIKDLLNEIEKGGPYGI